MLRIVQVLGFAILSSFLPQSAYPARGGESHAPMRRAAELVKAVQEEAAPSWEVAELGRAFDDLSETEVAALKQYENKAVALRAAWEQQRRLLSSASPLAKEEPSSLRVDRFLGFLEGRLRVAIPPTWEKMFAKGHLRSNRRVTFPATEELGRSHGESTTTVSLARINGTPEREFVIDGRTFALPTATVQKLRESGAENLTILLREDVCLALAHSDAGALRLIRYDLEAHEIVWESRIWGIGPGLFGGISEHRAAIACGAGNVSVFGITGLGAYVECFALADGAALLRFATNDWCNEGGFLPAGSRKEAAANRHRRTGR